MVRAGFEVPVLPEDVPLAAMLEKVIVKLSPEAATLPAPPPTESLVLALTVKVLTAATGIINCPAAGEMVALVPLIGMFQVVVPSVISTLETSVAPAASLKVIPISVISMFSYKASTLRSEEHTSEL